MIFYHHLSLYNLINKFYTLKYIVIKFLFYAFWKLLLFVRTAHPAKVFDTMEVKGGLFCDERLDTLLRELKQ